MSTEQLDLSGRVARFAALADPVRLRIVDLLTLGDLAPVELQDQLGISSSLLAHHLNSLEDAGMLARTRSEADRRRTYLHLTSTAFADLLPSPTMGVRRVVFVCTGNSARSQLATALWHRCSAVPVASAGTHPAAAIEPGAIATAARHGVALRARRPRAVDQVLVADDCVITVCDSAHEELGGRGRMHWSVPDPVRDGSDAAFDATFEDLAARVHDLAPRISIA